jgi:hypothetical protein
MVNTVCTSHQETTTAAIAKKIYPVTVSSDSPFVDLSNRYMAIKLASDATSTKRNIINLLESSRLAILRISFGCAQNGYPIQNNNAQSNGYPGN